jgi:hypothetical protein
LNRLGTADTTPTMLAVSWGGQYGIALMLLDAGADIDAYCSQSNQQLVHFIVEEEERSRKLGPKAKADYQELVQRVVARGYSLEKAREDHKRWVSWPKKYPIAKIGELRRKEVAERIAREKAKAEKAKSEMSD